MATRRVLVAATLLGVTLGLATSGVSSSMLVPVSERRFSAEIIALEPVPALHRTSALVATREAEGLLQEGRPWAAWRALEPHLESGSSDRVTMLAARAAAGWGDWQMVATLLRGRAELLGGSGGGALRLLAMAEESAGDWEAAARRYDRLLLADGGGERGELHARRARALSRGGHSAAAADGFAAAAAALPVVADWLTVLEHRARAETGTTDPGRLGAVIPPRSHAARVALARAVAEGWTRLDRPHDAVERLLSDARILAQQGAAEESAELLLEASRVRQASGELAEVREALRAIALEPSLSAPLRLRAAQRLGEAVAPRTAAEELARAAAYEAAGRPAQAAQALRAAFGQGAPDDVMVRLRLGRLLLEANDVAEARRVLTSVAEQLPSAERRAEAELLAARARLRSRDRAGGLDELRRLAERRVGTAAAGSALFLLADAAPSIQTAIPLYRRAAAVHHAPEAREALRRLGDRSVRAGDRAAAVRAWEEFVGRYPEGEESAELALSVGLLHRGGGRTDRATAMFHASIAADPLSYAAVRAGELLGIDPVAALLVQPRPWVELASDRAEATAVLERLALLDALQLEAAWRAELDGAVRRLARQPSALLTLAEGLRDGGHTVEGIRLGRRLLALRDGVWDVRLLRLVFPFPYRELLEAEAERYRVDPMLLAGLVRQESTFRPAIRSRVGATGLSQIMPATGRWIAPRVGIPAAEYHERLLAVPEVNLRMGALYLGDLMRRYEGASDLALAGYNAGPGRADRWRRELAYERDPDAFRDAIPFGETRHYVRIVLRNAAVYERLYRSPPPPAAPPLAGAEPAAQPSTATVPPPAAPPRAVLTR